MSAIPQIAALSPESLAAAIAKALAKGRERNTNGTWRTFCPAHNDESSGNPSLDVTVKNGKVVLYCQTRHCPQSAIIAELKAKGLWPDRPERRRLTLAEFSEKKKLPVDFLRANGVAEVENYGLPELHFPVLPRRRITGAPLSRPGRARRRPETVLGSPRKREREHHALRTRASHRGPPSRHADARRRRERRAHVLAA